MTNDALIEVLTDIQVEIQAIHLCLEPLGFGPEVMKVNKSEVEQDRESIRLEVAKRLSALQSGGQEIP